MSKIWMKTNQCQIHNHYRQIPFKVIHSWKSHGFGTTWMWVNCKIFMFGWTNPLIRLWKHSEANSPMWLVWFDCRKRSGMCSSALTNFPANYLNTHNHTHTWTHRSALCLPYHTVLPTVSAHTLLQLLSVLQIDQSTHIHTLSLSQLLCPFVFICLSPPLSYAWFLLLPFNVLFHFPLSFLISIT